MNRSPIRHRAGFTIAESVVALGLLGVVIVSLAEVTALAIAERGRSEARFAAVIAAGNVLEAAKAQPWADLTSEWAKKQSLPDHVLPGRPSRDLTVSVEPVPDRAKLKQVTAVVRWSDRAGGPPRQVSLTAVFADRSNEDQP